MFRERRNGQNRHSCTVVCTLVVCISITWPKRGFAVNYCCFQFLFVALLSMMPPTGSWKRGGCSEVYWTKAVDKSIHGELNNWDKSDDGFGPPTHCETEGLWGKASHVVKNKHLSSSPPSKCSPAVLRVSKMCHVSSDVPGCLEVCMV